MPKYKLTFYRTTNEYAEKVVEADNYDQAASMATKIQDDVHNDLDWNVNDGSAEFDVDEEG